MTVSAKVHQPNPLMFQCLSFIMENQKETIWWKEKKNFGCNNKHLHLTGCYLRQSIRQMKHDDLPFKAPQVYLSRSQLLDHAILHQLFQTLFQPVGSNLTVGLLQAPERNSKIARTTTGAPRNDDHMVLLHQPSDYLVVVGELLGKLCPEIDGALATVDIFIPEWSQSLHQHLSVLYKVLHPFSDPFWTNFQGVEGQTLAYDGGTDGYVVLDFEKLSRKTIHAFRIGNL